MSQVAGDSLHISPTTINATFELSILTTIEPVELIAPQLIKVSDSTSICDGKREQYWVS